MVITREAVITMISVLQAIAPVGCQNLIPMTLPNSTLLHDDVTTSETEVLQPDLFLQSYWQ